MSFKIVHVDGSPGVFVCGLYSEQRAEQWIEEQRAMMAAGRHIWMDKTLTADSFAVVLDDKQ